MARLNEVPVPTESLDALKRRFLRQNRELAKNNSTQSVRIRCLEAEVSRLLAENLHLREEILQWRNNLERGPDKYAIGAVKDKFDAKVQELSKLVAELGFAIKPPNEKSGHSPRREPTVGWGRGSNADLGDGSDGRLPAIREDKFFPRKTMDAEEIHASAESTESPDLGPPPIAHFQDEDPIKFNVQSTIPSSDAEKDENDLPASLSVNLETRRKRRDSSSKLAIRRMSVFHSPPEKNEDDGATSGKAINGTLPIRAGAKRKMSAREDDGKGEGKASEEFTFSRKANAAEDLVKVDKEKEKSGKDEGKARLRRESVTIQAPERRALGNKSVNTDPILSPKKTTTKGKTIDEKPLPKKFSEPIKEPPRPRDRRSTKPEPITISIPPPQESQPEVEEIQTSLPPKTPAALPDLFSPPTTEPSTARPLVPRDTPPPGELNGEGNGGRVARRARASVNYAEPSLQCKMRRPTKELLDAVGRDGRPLAGIAVPSRTSNVNVKTEYEDSEGAGWKGLPRLSSSIQLIPNAGVTEPTSPLSKKSNALKPISGNRNEMMGKERRDEEQHPQVQSAAAAAISTLIQNNASRRQSSTILLTKEKDTERASSRSAKDRQEEKRERDSLAVFDFVSSSPPPKDSHTSTSTATESSRARGSRTSLSVNSSVAVAKEKDERSGSKNASHKRQSSVNGFTSASISGAAAMNGVTGGEAEENAGVGMARSERLANRRKSSMML